MADKKVLDVGRTKSTVPPQPKHEPAHPPIVSRVVTDDRMRAITDAMCCYGD